MPRITMLDGRTIDGPTWENVEKDWANLFMNQLADDFRQEIAGRARVWSGVDIMTNGSSYDFLCEAERAGLIYGMSEWTYDDLPAMIAKYVPLARVVYLQGIAAKDAAKIERKQAKNALNG